MHLYLRLLKNAFTYAEGEKAELLGLLEQAPGVRNIKLVERHLKGGYAVTLEVDRASLDALIEFLPAHGLQSVF